MGHTKSILSILPSINIEFCLNCPTLTHLKVIKFNKFKFFSISNVIMESSDNYGNGIWHVCMHFRNVVIDRTLVHMCHFLCWICMYERRKGRSGSSKFRYHVCCLLYSAFVVGGFFFYRWNKINHINGYIATKTFRNNTRLEPLLISGWGKVSHNITSNTM